MGEAGMSADPWRWLRKCEDHLVSAGRLARLDGVPSDAAAIWVQFAAENLVGAATLVSGRKPTLLPELGAQIDALPSDLPLRPRFEQLRKHDGNEWRYGYPTEDGSEVASPTDDQLQAWLGEIDLLARDFAVAIRDLGHGAQDGPR